MSEFKIALGAKVKDRISGYVGIVTCRSQWLYGCVRYVIQSQELKDGKPIEGIGIDEDQAEVLDEPTPRKMKTRGGPKDLPSRQPDARR